MAKQTVADKDATANQASGSLVQRAVCKSSAVYSNASWDLVDAVRENKVDPAKLEANQLPEPLRNLKADELKARIEEAAKQRAAIQSQIATLNKEREAFVAEELIKQSATSVKTLDEVMVDVLEYAGYQTLEAADGHTGMEIALKATYRLLLLDLVMPGPSGFEILDTLKRKRPGQAVIILSARGEENDRVRGLVNGADDYVVKPFSMKELLARVDAVLRRIEARKERMKQLRALLAANPLPGDEWTQLNCAMVHGETSWNSVPKAANAEQDFNKRRRKPQS